jgi:hypothetical protein
MPSVFGARGLLYGPGRRECVWQKGPIMLELSLLQAPPLAAAGFALLYLLFGGGLGGAILLFIVLKMFGK